MDAKTLATKKRLKKTEIAFLIEKATELNIALPTNAECADCWRDLAVLVYAKEQPTNDLNIKPNVDIVWCGIRINAATITADLKTKMINAGLTKYFNEI